MLVSRIEKWLDHARDLGRDILSGSGPEAERGQSRMKLIAEAADIRTMATHLSYDKSVDRQTVHVLSELHRRMLAQIPLLAAIEDWLAGLNSRGLNCPKRQAFA